MGAPQERDPSDFVALRRGFCRIPYTQSINGLLMQSHRTPKSYEEKARKANTAKTVKRALEATPIRKSHVDKQL